VLLASFGGQYQYDGGCVYCGLLRHEQLPVTSRLTVARTLVAGRHDTARSTSLALTRPTMDAPGQVLWAADRAIEDDGGVHCPFRLVDSYQATNDGCRAVIEPSAY